MNFDFDAFVARERARLVRQGVLQPQTADPAASIRVSRSSHADHWAGADAAEQRRLAQLADAAPAMLAVCQALVDVYDDRLNDDESRELLVDDIAEQAADAIHAATGRRP